MRPRCGSRWRVFAIGDGRWLAGCLTHWYHEGDFPTWHEAMRYARSMARADR